MGTLLWVMLAAQLQAPPPPPEGSVFRAWSAHAEHPVVNPESSAVLVRHKSQLVVLAPYSPYGMSRGLEGVPGDALGGLATLKARDLWTGKWAFKALQAQDNAAATPVSGFQPGGVVVYPLSLDDKDRGPKGKLPLQALALAPGCPEDGERVWLAARIQGQTPAMPLHAAEVLDCDVQQLELRFEDRLMDLSFTPGAPVLNSAGQVVALFQGGYAAPRQAEGIGVSAATLRALIAQQPVPEIERDLSGLDWEALHGEGELLLNWGLTGQDEERVRQALALDEELLEVFDTLSALSWRNNMGNFGAISEQVLLWNAIYIDGEIPLRLSPVAAGQQLVLLAHHVLSEWRVQVGSQTVPMLLIERIEGSNVAAPTLARTDETPEVWVNAARVRSEAALVWAQLGRNAELDAEIQAALGPADFADLLAGAPARRKAEAALDSINARSSCSRFGLYEVGIDGLSPELLAQLERYVGSGRCARVTAAELKALKALPEAPPAFQRLSGHVLRGVVLQGAQEGELGVQSALADASTQWSTRARLCTLSKRGHPDAEAAQERHGVCGAGALKELPTGWTAVQLPELPERIGPVRGELR